MRVIAVVSLLLLGACSSMTPAPVGIGSGPHELKRSPCACVEIPMDVPASAGAAAVLS